MSFDLRKNKMTPEKRTEEINAYFQPQTDTERLLDAPEEQELLPEYAQDVLLHWQGPEYENYPKDRRWYIIATAILAAIVAYALFTNSPLMTITFILIGVVGYIYLEKGPRVYDFRITHEGVMAGNELYAFDDIEAFWIFYEPPHTKVLSLHMRGTLMPYIHIPVHQVDPVKIREILLGFIPERKQEPSVVDTLERLLHI